MSDDEYQALLYTEAEAHKRFMRAAAYFPDACTVEELMELANEVVAINNMLDAMGTIVRTVETVEEIQGVQG